VTIRTLYNFIKSSINIRHLIEKQRSFAPLGKLSTRVLNSLKATDASRQVEEHVQAMVRKVQGKRATPKKSDEAKQAAAAKGKGAKEISSSQMSYVSRLDNFGQLIKLLADISKYAPNEEELNKTSISSLYDSLLRHEVA
jgi:hypothetical protein